MNISYIPSDATHFYSMSKNHRAYYKKSNELWMIYIPYCEEWWRSGSQSRWPHLIPLRKSVAEKMLEAF